jgi:hypothetical protein
VNGCGFADDLRVPRIDSIVPLPAVQTRRVVSATPDWVPDTPVPGLARFALGPSLNSTSATRWFALSPQPDVDVGILVSGRPSSADRLELQWGSKTGVVLRRDVIRLRPTASEDASMSWRLFTRPELRPPPAQATLARLLLENDGPTAGAIAVTGPISYSYESLARRLSTAGVSTLALPHTVTFFPCVELPTLRNGSVETPNVILTTLAADPLLLDPGTSPFRGVLDIYDLERLTVGDSMNRPTNVIVYTLNPALRGWKRVEPAVT